MLYLRPELGADLAAVMCTEQLQFIESSMQDESCSDDAGFTIGARNGPCLVFGADDTSVQQVRSLCAEMGTRNSDRRPAVVTVGLSANTLMKCCTLV